MPDKTQRILSIYHLLTHCKEVSFKEMTDLMPGCRKSFSRSIRVLKAAGVRVRYARAQNAFVLHTRERAAPALPENGPGRLYLEKIIRLTLLMDGIPEEDPDAWYRENFPQTSLRTMQRDFAVLNSIGYRIFYNRESYDYTGCEPRHYYCEAPMGTYDLSTFKRLDF